MNQSEITAFVESASIECVTSLLTESSIAPSTHRSRRKGQLTKVLLNSSEPEKLIEKIKNFKPLYVKDGTNFKCGKCEKVLKSKRTIKKHIGICSIETEINEKTVQCDLCDKQITRSNIARHLQKHKNDTPGSIARIWKKTEKKKQKNFKCIKCNNYYFDKSTLLRHIKIHKLKEKKKVTWSLNLTEEKEIDINKIKLDSKNIIACKHLFNHIKNVFAVCASNSMSYIRFKENYARIEKSSVDDITVRILLSLLPEAITIKLKQNVVTVMSAITMENHGELFSLLCDRINEEKKENYIEITELPSPVLIKNKTAMEFIKENTLQIKHKTVTKELTLHEKIAIHQNNKNERQKEIEKLQIGWKSERLVRLRRLIVKLFYNKTSINENQLKNKLVMNGIPVKHLNEDFDTIIKEGLFYRYSDSIVKYK